MQLLDLLNFEHEDISVNKMNSTILVNTFGDLAKIRNSFWHSRSGDFGICNFKESEFSELNNFMKLEKGKLMEISANELPQIGHHLSKRLFEFPQGYSLGMDTRK